MEDLQVEDGTDERDEDSSSPSTTSAFNASFIRYEKDDGEREELARAASKVKKLPKFLLFLGVEEIFLPSMWYILSSPFALTRSLLYSFSSPPP